MKKTLIAATLGLVLALSATNANAATITFVGTVIDGIPSGTADEVNYINSLIQVAPNTLDPECNLAPSEVCDRTNSNAAGPFPTAILTGATKDENAPFNPVSVFDFTYILAKYGNEGSLVWLISGAAPGDTFNVPTGFQGTDNLSHVSLYRSLTTTVPDGGATLGLLGLAMFGIGVLRRRLA